MAEEETEKTEEKSGGSPILLIALVGIVALALGAGATYFLVGGGQESSAEEAAQAEKAQPEAAPVPFSERVVALEPFVVNIESDPYPRFLKVRVELEVEKPEHKAILDERLAQVRDALIVLITSKRISDVTDFEGKALLKQEILDRVNGLLDEPFVRSVLFTEFVIQ